MPAQFQSKITGKIASKMITAILPKGMGVHVVRHLKNKKGIISANSNHCRGTGMASPKKGGKGIGQIIEKDIVNVIVPEEKGEELFEYIFEQAHINRPHGGFMYMTSIPGFIPFKLPKGLPEEK